MKRTDRDSWLTIPGGCVILEEFPVRRIIGYEYAD